MKKKIVKKHPLSELQWDKNKIHTKIVQFSEAILCTFCLKIYGFFFTFFPVFKETAEYQRKKCRKKKFELLHYFSMIIQLWHAKNGIQCRVCGCVVFNPTLIYAKYPLPSLKKVDCCWHIFWLRAEHERRSNYVPRILNFKQYKFLV